MPGDAAQEVLDRCAALGFALAGIAHAGPSERAGELFAWLAAGKHGGMDYLARDAEIRADPARLLRGARSFIMVADAYPGGPPAPAAPGRGLIARYARGRDYHAVMKRRLHRLCDGLRVRFPGEEFRSFVDTAPAPERELAARAGLGWIGKHTLLIHPRRGSWLLLGGAATTMDLARQGRGAIADHCGACTRCIDACPTGAITPYSVDARRCISYLTIEHRGPIDPGAARAVGPWIFGCDVCQEVCPHNAPRAGGTPRAPAEPAGGPRPEYAPRRDGFDLLDVLGWKEADRRVAFSTSPLKRASLTMIRRNAAIAAANGARAPLETGAAGAAAAALSARLEQIAADPAEPLPVRAAAQAGAG